MDCSLPGSSICGIFRSSILEWVAISFSRGSSRPRDQTQGSRIAGRHFTLWATRGAASGGIGSAWGQASIFCSVILFTLDWFLFTDVSFFSFLIYENVRGYWTCLWLERIIKGCTNYISCQINITLPSPAADLTSQSHLGCWKLCMYLSGCNSYDSWSVKSSHRSSGSIVPILWMPWGMRFCVSYLKPKWFVFFFVCPVLCCCVQAFCRHLEQGLLSSCGARALHCGGFSCCRKQVQGTQASVLAARELSTCGSQAQGPTVSGILPDQASNPCPLRGQADP